MSKIQVDFGLCESNGVCMGVDPEVALRRSNDKFTRRFKYIERELEKRGKRPVESDLDEMDALWNEIRRAEKTAD